MRNRVLFGALSLLMACNARGVVSNGSKSGQKNIYPKDSTLKINGVEVWVQRPSDSIVCKGTLLLLPGWNFDFHRWCDSTDVCSTALAKGLAVVCPQMMRSVYASNYFPETRSDLRAYPTLLWLDSALDIMKSEHGLFQGNNFVLGLSTGGRGVALVCERKPDFFAAAAALSGDFDQSTMPEDRLTTLVYGPYKDFKKRWKNLDNPSCAEGLDSFRTPIYIGHGAKDKVVPPSQTKAFKDSLLGPTRLARMGWLVYYHLDPTGGHDFNYWRSELPAVWRFFDPFMHSEE